MHGIKAWHWILAYQALVHRLGLSLPLDAKTNPTVTDDGQLTPR